MQLRKANKHGLLILLLIVCTWTMIGVPSDALAQNPTLVLNGNGQICAESADPVERDGFTARFVNCIQDTVGWALSSYLQQFIAAFVTTVNALIVLAIIVYGFTVLSGRAQPSARDAFMLMIKIAVIVWLINLGNYNGLFPVLVDTVNWMLGLVTNYTAFAMSPYSPCPYQVSVWNRVDCVLDVLIGGILPGSSLAFGIVGLLLAFLFAGGIGIALFFFGVGIILSILMAVLQSLFIIISAYIALALLSLLAPIAIPLILFRNTKQYFDKWLRMIIGVMLQPIFLFAYLALFLIAIEVSVFTGQYSVFRAISCERIIHPAYSIGTDSFAAGNIKQRSGNTSIFGILIDQNPKKSQVGADGAVAVNDGVGGVAASKKVDPGKLEEGAISVDIPTDAIDFKAMAAKCGTIPSTVPADEKKQYYLVRLILSLFTALAVIYIFYTMLNVIPYLGTLISGDLFGLPNLSKMLPLNSVHGTQLMSNLGFGKKGGK